MHYYILLSFCFFLIFSVPCNALKAECDKFAPSDSIVMDYFFNDEITRHKAYYKDGEINVLLGYKKAKQIWFRKFYSSSVADSIVYYDDVGNIDFKVRYNYTPKRKILMGRQFNTQEDVRSRFIGNPDDVAVKTVELYKYGAKSMELVFNNDNMSHLIVYDYKGPHKFTKKETVDSILRYTYMPSLDEDLTGRPPSEISSFIKSSREMRDIVSKCMSRYRDASGTIFVEFSIKRDGTVPDALILKSTVSCKNIGIELMNVIKNITFPSNSKYGTATVMYPFQF